MHTYGNNELFDGYDGELCGIHHIKDGVDLCSKNKILCKYGLHTGNEHTYCIHPNRRSFIVLSNKDVIDSS